MDKSYQLDAAGLAIALAVAVTYVALFLGSRVETSRGGAARLWIGGGAIALGLGTWCTHFLGMIAWEAPFPLSYDPWLQIMALLLSTCAYAAALYVFQMLPRSASTLLTAILLLAGGITANEFINLRAIAISPETRFAPANVALALVLAVVGTATGLSLNGRLSERPQFQLLTRISAAFVLGATVIGTHYAAMGGLVLAAEAVDGQGVPLDGFWLAVTIGAIVFAMVSMTGVLMVVDDHMAARARKHDAQLDEANAKLRYAGLHDVLTGLPNRSLLRERMAQLIDAATLRSTRCAVMIVNLDRFKAVNDSLGQAAGDQVLCEVTSRLRSVLRPTDTVARTGSDEFVILRDAVRDSSEVDLLASGIQREIAREIHVEGSELQITCSTGIALFPSDGRDVATLLRHAGAALQHGKSTGSQQRSFYQPQMDRFARERLAVETGLRRALANDEFVLHYQPKLEVATNRITGAEALIRWRHPQRGLVPPAEFIPVAEETGLITPMTEWALREATRQMRAWQDAGMAPLRVSVNLSAGLLGHPDLEALVMDAVSHAELDPTLLELELTESAVMRDPERSIEVLRSLVRRGLRISVDDFGTGYSSLSYLRRLPLHVLKVDRSFIRDVVSNHEDAEITRSIVSLAHSLKLQVTAEGVETDRQLAFLKSLGCDEYQGFLASAAVPADDFAALTQQSMSATQKLRILGQRARGALLRA
ncbi:MAG: EAL domain-containing protein [Steroidobacteraceae bacterium]